MLLKDLRVDPTDDKNKALINAMSNGHVEVAKILYADDRVRTTITQRLFCRYRRFIQPLYKS